jgi:hypothetical protein
MVTRRTIVITDARREPVAAGYQRDGLSMHSHTAAQGHRTDSRTRDHAPDRSTWTKLDVLIQHERKVIERLERRAAECRANPDMRFPIGRSPTFLGICSRLQKTRTLVRRLEADRQAGAT